MVDVQLK